MKLPAGKYTVREREMLSGVAGAPESYFMPGNAFSNSIIVGAAPVLAILAGISTVVRGCDVRAPCTGVCESMGDSILAGSLPSCPSLVESTCSGGIVLAGTHGPALDGL